MRDGRFLMLAGAVEVVRSELSAFTASAPDLDHGRAGLGGTGGGSSGKGGIVVRDGDDGGGRRWLDPEALWGWSLFLRVALVALLVVLLIGNTSWEASFLRRRQGGLGVVITSRPDGLGAV